METLGESYDRSAAVYARAWAPALARLGRLLLDAMPLERARWVLDAGCGTGALLPGWRAAAPQATVVGIDLSPGMLRRGPAGQVIARADLRRTPFADARFDGAVASFVLFHLPEPLAAVRELARVLRPGAPFGTTSWVGEPDFPAHRVWVEELLRAGPAPQSPTADHDAVDTPDKVRRLYRDAGFATPAVRERALDFAFEPEALIELRAHMGRSGRRFASLEPARRETMLRAVRRRFAELPPAAFVDRNRAILAWARRT